MDSSINLFFQVVHYLFVVAVFKVAKLQLFTVDQLDGQPSILTVFTFDNFLLPACYLRDFVCALRA